MPVPSEDPRNRDAATQPIPVGPPAQPQYDPPPPLPQPPSVPRARTRKRYWIGGIVAILILAGATLSSVRERPGPAAGADSEDGAPAEKDIPPTLRPYYDRAITGDASAMRMLGTMYYNGLNVPQNTREGIRWYRKAAAAGSVAAGKDLQQLGLAPE